MTVSLHAIGTALPPSELQQAAAARLFAEQPAMTRLGSRLTRSVFDGSGVSTRRSVLPELTQAMQALSSSPADAGSTPAADGPGVTDSAYLDPGTGRLRSPSTSERNELYTRAAPELFTAAARAALSRAPHLSPREITHVITVSCTGFFAPGPDAQLTKALDLSPDVSRAHLGFMGCNAAFGALRTAAAHCRSDPQAVVLVVCAELCTLHLHVRNDPDTIMGNALFADGAAAALVSARPAPTGSELPELIDQQTMLAPAGERELAWSIGDEGFEMVLGTYVPAIIDDHVTEALDPLLQRAGLRVGEIEHWAVHPGGREILDRVEARLGLSTHQMAASRQTLAQVGNISSATILFVLDRLISSGASGTACAMAFGPGLSIESALLRLPEQA